MVCRIGTYSFARTSFGVCVGLYLWLATKLIVDCFVYNEGEP